MFLDVVKSTPKVVGIVLQEAYGGVATVAEQTADAACLSVVVDAHARTGTTRIVGTADRAHVTLHESHEVVVVHVDAIAVDVIAAVRSAPLVVLCFAVLRFPSLAASDAIGRGSGFARITSTPTVGVRRVDAVLTTGITTRHHRKLPP